MKKEDRKLIVKLLDEAEELNTVSSYQNVIDYLNSIKDSYADDAEFNYFMGYTTLFFPDNEEFYKKMALSFLEMSYALDSANKNTYFHLMNCHYALGHYKIACDGYIEILYLLKKEKNQVASLSVFERILVCFLHLNMHAKFIANYDLWIRAYRSTQDVESMTIPRDLIIALANYLKNKGDRIKPELVYKFKNATFDLLWIIDLFPISKKNYKKEIESLKNWDGQFSGPYIFELVK